MADSGSPLVAIFPAPPRPPSGQWTADYGNQLDRWLRNVTDQLSGFTYERVSGMLWVGPFSPEGLRTGEVFANVNVLTVIRLNDAWLWPGVSATGAVGTITVSV